MCETDIALAVLFLLGPLWLAEQAVVDSSLRLCHSFVESVKRRVSSSAGLATDVDPNLLRRRVAFSDAEDDDPPRGRSGKASASRADEVSPTRARRLDKLARFRPPPIELRRGFRARPRPAPTTTTAEGSDASPSTSDRDSPIPSSPLTTTPPNKVVAAPAIQPSLSGCRRAVASSLLKSRPNIAARRSDNNSNSTSTSTSSTTARSSASTTATFMASFKMSQPE